jgi:hypothetical protein
VSSLFTEPAPVVERTTSSLEAASFESSSIDGSPIEAFGATTHTSLDPTLFESAVFASPPPLDPTGTRFARLAQSVAAGTGDRPAILTTFRSHAWNTLRSDLRPSVAFDDDAPPIALPPPLARFETAESPRPWHRLRRRPEPAQAAALLADAPSSAPFGRD